ncbi:MAG TPA: sensor histidine kinase [Pseudonocardiaceae bacterium]|jgi:anti-sigma regulatory factor (Ser/Thr protein kinase)|nr:sensor histidine kinase [Pseudonocardiaceae bacterium]
MTHARTPPARPSVPTPGLTHPALFYRDREEYLAGTIPFVVDGLAGGEPVAAVVPTENLALLRAELGRQADRITLIDMAEAGRNPGRIIPGVLHAFADAHPYHRVRIISEQIWPGRSSREYPACVRHEALINVAFAERRMTMLCPYDSANLEATALADASATHPVLIAAERRWPSQGYRPEQIIDTYNLPLPTPSADVFVAGVRDLSALRRFVTDRATRLGVSADRVADLVLVVSELATNSIEHGGGEATVTVFADGDQIGCQVYDTGRLTDQLAGLRPATVRQSRGRGLLLVNELAELVRTHASTNGTTVRTWLRRDPTVG